jgi:hypothetical protein
MAEPKRCILCKQILPADARPWWQRWWQPATVPVHSTWPGVSEATLDKCWAGWNAMMGIKNPGPRPVTAPSRWAGKA